MIKILSASHPYLDRPAQIEVEILDELPGREYQFRRDRDTVTDPTQTWTPLAGPFFVDPENPRGTAHFKDADALLSILWDMEGKPMHETAPRRQRADYCVVRTVKGTGRHRMVQLEVYRRTSEMTHESEHVAVVPKMISDPLEPMPAA